MFISDGESDIDNIEEISNEDDISDDENKEILNVIKNCHKDLGLNDNDLFKEIAKCIKYKRINFDFIKLISEFVFKMNSPEKIKFLREFYKFINMELWGEDIELIRIKVPKIILKFESNIKNLNSRDIMNEIKKEIIFEKLYKIDDIYKRKIITKCIEKNWNFECIKIFISELNFLFYLPEKDDIEIKIQNEKKINIIKSLLEIIEAFPIDINYLSLILKEINFSNIETISRDFYITCSKIFKNPAEELTVDELLEELANKNFNYFTQEKLIQFKNLIKIAKNTTKPNDFKKWIEQKFINYDFKSNKKYEYIAETLGIISWGLNETKLFHLREAQLLAIIIFIDNNESQIDENNEKIKNEIIENNEKVKKKYLFNDNSKGIIEEISTGEGKSVIISCLAAYFGLRNHKVDVITSSKTLSQRDSIEFKEFYNIFNLKVDYVRDGITEPYKADIIYGTFPDFEGDYLEEIVNKKQIRRNRPYDIIIIDEVDYFFIDDIQGNTELTQSYMGYQFLEPIYFSIYYVINFIDNLSLEEIQKISEKIITKEESNILKEELKNIFFKPINDDNIKRKDIILAIVQKMFESILDIKINDNNKKNEEFKNDEGILKIFIEKINNYIDDITNIEKIKNISIFPKFLNEFIKIQLKFWINNAYLSKCLYEKEVDYTFTRKSGITPIDGRKTGELQFNKIYKDGLHQMLQIKENFRINRETLTYMEISYISYFLKYKKKNFFGLT